MLCRIPTKSSSPHARQAECRGCSSSTYKSQQRKRYVALGDAEYVRSSWSRKGRSKYPWSDNATRAKAIFQPPVPKIYHQVPHSSSHSNKQTMSVKTVGYIGLGKAGASMASNLPRAGFHLVVRDADHAREEEFAQKYQNVTVAERKDAFKNCDVIITMLPQGKVVREVILGENGIAKGLKSGTVMPPRMRSLRLMSYRRHHRRHVVFVTIRHSEPRQGSR